MLLNRERALEQMRQCRLDALVATSPVNVEYLTDYYWWLDPLTKEYMMSPGETSDLAFLFAVLPGEEEPALVLNSLLAINAADIWVKDIHTFGRAPIEWSDEGKAWAANEAPRLARLYEMLKAGTPNATPLNAFVAICKERGLTEGRIGIELDGVSPERRAALRERLPRAQLLDCSNLFRYIRIVKSPEEIERLTRAAEISELAARMTFSRVLPGGLMSEAAERYRVAVAEGGAQFDHFAYAPRGLGIATEPEHVFDEADVMYVDFACIYKHYFSDSGFTLAVKPPSPESERRYADLRACVDAGIAQLRPGVKCSDAQKAMAGALAALGPYVSYPHGHAIGLEVRDYPILAPATGKPLRDDCIDISSDLPLEAGMVLNLEASFFRAGVDSFNLEQSFVITPDGNRPLIEQDRSRIFSPELTGE
jgi:Xaa-Pro aminopeptidase